MENITSTPCGTDSCFNQNDGNTFHVPLYISIYIAVANTIIFTTGIICNLVIIAVVIVFKHMHTNINFYLVNLSVADLCVLLVCQPVAMVEYFNKERWLLGSAVCKLVPVLESTVQHASTLTTLAITFERMLAICKPLAVYTKKRRRSRILIPLIWLFSVALAAPFAGIAETTDVKFIDGSFGTICHAPVDRIWKKVFVVCGIAFFFILIVLMAFMHVKIIRKLRNSASLRRFSESDSINASSWSQYNLLNSTTQSFLDAQPQTSSSSKEISVNNGFHQWRRRLSNLIGKQTISPVVNAHGSQIKILIFIVVYLFISYMPIRVFILYQIMMRAQAAHIGVESYLNLIWAFRLLIYLHSASNPFIYSFMSTKFMKILKGRVILRKKRKGEFIGRLPLSLMTMTFPRQRAQSLIATPVCSKRIIYTRQQSAFL